MVGVEQQGLANAVSESVRRACPDRRLCAIWLYGSEARGEAKSDSDIDLAILADSPLDPIELGLAAVELEGRLGRRVDLVDLRRASVLLRVQATYGGKLLLAPDSTEAALFETHAISDYGSFAANRKMCTDAMLEKFRG